MAKSFRAPKDNGPTRHLFVANCGVASGLSESTIKHLFEDLGAVTVQDEDKRSIVFASFNDAEKASHAAAVLTSEDICRKYRRFTVKYAELKEEEVLQKGGQFVYLDTEKCGVPGLQLLLDFVTPEEEQALLSAVDQGEWEILASRRVQHYGYRFEYKTRSVSDPMQPFPPATAPILQRLQCLPDLPHLDQLTVNEYRPGVGLAPHIDTHSAFTGAIASLSLSGGCIMEMRKGVDHRAVYLPPRSLLIMAGASRYEWLHYIPHRKSDTVQGVAVPRSRRRVSFTFRKIRGFPCDCSFPKDCDSQDSCLPPTRMQQLELDEQREGVEECDPHGDSQMGNGTLGSAELAEGESEARVASGGEAVRDHLSSSHPGEKESAMESRHVHAVYEVIASHFSATRFAVWPKVREFLMALPRRGILADVGCGNGKYFAVRPDIVVLASDRSSGLAAKASGLCGPERGGRFRGLGSSVADARGAGVAPRAPLADVIVADGMCLPYRRCCVDGVMSIAVLHHISSVPRRLQFLEQMARVLKPGGLGLVTVWASQQEEKKLAKWERIPAGLSTSEQDDVTASQPGGAGGDYFVPWHVPFHRADAVSAIRSASGKPDGNDSAANRVSNSNQRAGGTIDRGTSSVVFKRYYHLFEEGELDGLVARVAGVILTASFYDKSNWCCIFRRTPD